MSIQLRLFMATQYYHYRLAFVLLSLSDCNYFEVKSKVISLYCSIEGYSGQAVPQEMCLTALSVH